MTRPGEIFCFRCKKPWWPWPASQLPCHAQCYLAPEIQDDLYLLKLRFPLVSVRQLATDFGVTTGVMRASLFAAAKRAGAKVTAWGR